MEAAGLSIDRRQLLEGAEGWTAWHFKIKVMLRAAGLLDIVDGTLKPPEDKSEIEKWEVKDAKAQNLIVMHVSEKIIPQISNCQSACEIWSKLLTIFEQKGELSVHILQQKFFAMRYEENDSMSQYLSRFEGILCKLRNINAEVSDSMAITKITSSLPVQYQHFVSAWESVPADKRTLEELTARLLIEEQRFNSRKEEEEVTAFAAFKGRKCFKCGKIGHYKKDCRSGNQNGCIEREMRTTTEAARSILLSSGLNKSLWAEAVNTAVFVINRTEQQMPTINEENIVSEEEMTSTEEKESSEEELEGYSTPDRAVSEMVDRQNLEVEEITTEDVDEGIPESNLRRSKRTIKKPQYLKDYETNFLTTSVEPLTIEEALTSDAKENWKDAMKTEMDTLNENNTWTIVDDVPDEARMKRTRECKHSLACDASSTRAPLTRAPKTAPDASAGSGEASEEASHERLFTFAPRPSPPRSPRHSCESVNGV
ncbi:unnamed protein product [Plutella xylostella]|uniref:(diamondback moth) hypothetical protein n=1 Tax=Plutella xylostella TaxID=51655 RepID=A0A8S4D1Z3_PLUXY|nr:unnamed protein product [Plutella xylostella]